MAGKTAEAPDYSVPALEKAFDIIELLAEQKDGLNQGQISEAVGRSIHQIYRVLQALERRGYIFRDRPAGLYFLSPRLFELAHRHEPLRGLVQAALPSMRRLSDAIQQSCNLGVHNAGRVLILAQVESPAAFGFRVRVGAEFPLFGTATGRTLMAFQPQDRINQWLQAAGIADEKNSEVRDALVRIRDAGHEEVADGLQPGVIDLAFPVIGPLGHSVAALTVPYVATSYSVVDLATVRRHAAQAAHGIALVLAPEPSA
ncbi:IclR family transcriptional regulator [Mesorhizobium sp. BH1-1-4]|uniref:IclR family transcriptional regulator n=1 Tax=Mesorhizobium sp. BH1-1-4 TaxID=2876662 RepID=UPI001CD1877A|nr:IclR family transcriptional regulator [Mesorhizobium sp. BH1-1-4]MBZ9995761.1 IclR family transcriptional regulator [Mesorhizobium sp. BH1-1-4]